MPMYSLIGIHGHGHNLPWDVILHIHTDSPPTRKKYSGLTSSPEEAALLLEIELNVLCRQDDRKQCDEEEAGAVK